MRILLITTFIALTITFCAVKKDSQKIIFAYLALSIPLFILILNIGGMTLERFAWRMADELSHGVLTAKTALIDNKLQTFGNYQQSVEGTLRDLDGMTWEEYKTREKTKLGYELQIVRFITNLVSSFRSTQER